MFRLGMDVGGTNTDAVILDEEDRIIGKHKDPTTQDVTTGILNSLDGVLEDAKIDRSKIKYAMLGTTHATNAIATGKDLNRIGVIRIGKPATLAIKPLSTWPDRLIESVGGFSYIVTGGHEFDGREIAPLDEDGVASAAEEIKEEEVESVAISSVFSPVNSEHEERAAEIVKKIFGDRIHLSISHEIGTMSLLERENAAALNSAVVGVVNKAVESFRISLMDRGIDCELFLNQNDGTLMNMDFALKYPVLTIASGPSNSLRGAVHLSGLKDGIVVDVGGTTTDIGIIEKGFPRESSESVEIGRVRTNFRMPDLVTLGLGGGSLVKRKDESVEVGPESVGYEINERARIFGGEQLTATDIVVASGDFSLGNREFVRDVDEALLKEARRTITSMVEEGIDRIKTDPKPVSVALVGGGSILLPEDLEGASTTINPENFEVANAIGAAMAQVSGQVDEIFSLDEMDRDETLKEAKEKAKLRAVEAGADSESLEVIDIEEIPLAYLPGNATRIKAKVMGELETQ